jgi:methionine-gamma-lyase
MKKHSENAMYLAEKFEKDGLKVNYPGLKSHRNHELMKSMMHQKMLARGE